MNDKESAEIVKKLFDRYDTNKNGVLERSEFVNGLEELIQILGEPITSETVELISEEAIQNFDLNKNGIIEYNEFTELIKFLIEEKGLKLSKL